MIKAAGIANGRPLLILGLSGENMARLLDGQPIMLDTAALGLPAMDVIVMGGRTEDDILDAFRGQGIRIRDMRDQRGTTPS